MVSTYVCCCSQARRTKYLAILFSAQRDVNGCGGLDGSAAKAPSTCDAPAVATEFGKDIVSDYQRAAVGQAAYFTGAHACLWPLQGPCALHKRERAACCLCARALVPMDPVDH
jgi:hypothetical protein